MDILAFRPSSAIDHDIAVVEGVIEGARFRLQTLLRLSTSSKVAAIVGNQELSGHGIAVWR
jgi:hypothetical protein